MIEITLPWPPSVLNPNAVAHWSKKYAAKKKYKNACYALALNKANFPPLVSVPLTIIFNPPKRGRRDADNCLAAFKAGLDGITLAWKIDDSRFTPITSSVAAEPVKGGSVIVRAG